MGQDSYGTLGRIGSLEFRNRSKAETLYFSTPAALNKYTFYIDFMNQTRQSVSAPPPKEIGSPIVELRQYTLRHGKRDVLIDIFKREFLDGQEGAGIEIIGQFRDLDNPDRFVWLRGFPDMASRPQKLEAFYTSPTWKAHRDAVNEILVDSDNVLLLRHAWTGSEFPRKNRAPLDEVRTSLVTANICSLHSDASSDFVQFFNSTIKPILTATGAPCLASFITESTANNYPRLPLRDGENVFVWFTFFRNQASYDHHIESLSQTSNWPGVREEMHKRLIQPIQTLKLAPTLRSKVG